MFMKLFKNFVYEEATDEGDISLVTPVDDVTPPEEPQEEPKEFEGPEWMANLSDEFKADKSLLNFKDVNDLAKSYIHSRKLIGKDKIVIPDEHATEDDWNEFHKKLGLPERENYKLNFGDAKYSDDFKNGFIENAHKAGIRPKQAEQIFEFFNNQVASASEEAESTYQERQKEAVEGLKKEWGAGYDKNIKKAQTAFQMFADDETINYLNESGLAKDVNLIKLFSKIGDKLNEDTFDRNTVSHLGMTKEEAQEKIESVMGDFNHPYWNQDHPNHKAAVEKMTKYNKIVGS